MQMRLVVISGLSCSGKSTLARNLSLELGGEMIRMDDYYFETDPAQFETTDFDDPNMVDIGLLILHIRALKAGETIESPHYDFVECRYVRHRTIQPTPFLIVEGQYAAAFPGLVELAELSVFLDVSDAECLERRLVRDQTEFGRTREDSERRFATRVIPAFNKHRAGIRACSDVCLGPGTQAEWISTVRQSLDQK